MKKSVLYFAAFILQLTAGNAQVCTPDPQYTQPGIYPDSITNLDTGMVGVPYSDTITAVIPADTVDANCCGVVTVDSMVLTGISGLPPGLSYQCNPPSCGFPGGTSGCVLISGIPTDTGTFNLTANVTAYVVCCPVLFGCAGCSQVPISNAVSYYTIVIKPPLSASITASTNVDCKGNCNGQATVTAAGGTPPYTYSWDDPFFQTAATAGSLCAGTYTVTVTDADNSTVNVSVTITEPANALTGTMSGTDETCGGCNDGTAKVVASGGTSPYTYSWNTTPIQTTDSIVGLAPATYTVTVTDANGCTFNGSVIVNPSGCALSSSGSGTDETCVSCNDGTITITVSGGTAPYTYILSTGDTILTPGTLATFVSLVPGTYSFTVTDSAGCSSSGSVTVNAYVCALSASASGTDETCAGCNDGTAKVVASGGTSPYTYSWNTTPIQTTDSISGLAPGTYSFTVTDSAGCSSSGSVTVNAYVCTLSAAASSTDETIANNKDGTATIAVSGGTPPYTYNWGTDTIVTADTVSTITGLAPGPYSVTVTDAGGCFKTEVTTVGAGPSSIQPFDELTNRVSVYPNPAFNEINVVAFFNEHVFFNIVDILGRQIKSVIIEGETTKVNTAELAEGLYIYQILNRQGAMLNRGKFSIAK